MSIFCLDDSIYYFVKCLSSFEKMKCRREPKDYFNYLSDMSLEQLNKEYDLLSSFKYEFTYLSNSIITNLYNEIRDFDVNNLKESFNKLYKNIEIYFLKILDIINGKEKIRIIEGKFDDSMTKDDVFAFATTVIGASYDVDNYCFGLFDNLLYLLHYFAYFIDDFVSSLFKREFFVEFDAERSNKSDEDVFLIERFSDIQYTNKEVRKKLVDENGNIILANIKYELQRAFNSLIDDYDEYCRFITTALHQLNLNNQKFRFWKRKLSSTSYKFLSDDINELVFEIYDD